MEGYIQALIDTHRREINDRLSPHQIREIEDRIAELQGILDYYKRKELEKTLSSFVIACKAKDLDTQIRKVCRR